MPTRSRSRRGGSRHRSVRHYSRKRMTYPHLPSFRSLKSIYPSTKRLEAAAKKEIHRVARLARGNSISSIESAATSSAKGIRSLTSAFNQSFRGSLGKVVKAAKSVKKATRRKINKIHLDF